MVLNQIYPVRTLAYNDDLTCKCPRGIIAMIENRKKTFKPTIFEDHNCKSCDQLTDFKKKLFKAYS